MEVPAGFTQIVYKPEVRTVDRTTRTYIEVTGDVEITAAVSDAHQHDVLVRSGGMIPSVIRAASAYETATHYRTPPPSFGVPTAKPIQLSEKQ